ncbi:MAG: cadmium-translocating P-type ATPase [Clostridia bacterium]|nr:cadmium-translocating P-type ATPase [Clostridia bacterium]
MSRRQKENLYRIIAATVLFVGVVLLPFDGIWKMLLFLVPYFIVGYDVLYGAIRNITNGHVFEEKFLMSLATVGAFIIGEYPEAVFVMLFFQIGELFQNIAVGRSRKSISDLMDIAPEIANVLCDGEFCEVSPEEIKVGDTLLIKPGEKIPVDAYVVKGQSYIDTSAMTGESIPKFVSSYDNVISGCINTTNPIEVVALKEYADSTVMKVLELVEHSAMNKGRYESFITRFARFYTPVVVLLALVVAFVPPIFLGNLTQWVLRALSFLVVSCPCALVISVPLSFFGGIGAASRRGVLVKGSNYLEILAQAKVVVTDKTGTLTTGKLLVTDFENKEATRIASSIERFSNHPVARAVSFATNALYDVQNVCEIPGKGMSATCEGKEVVVGSRSLLEENGIEVTGKGNVFIGIDGSYAGGITVTDFVKENARDTVKALHAMGIEKVVMLTGDSEKGAKAVFKETAIDEMYHSLLPVDKVKKLEEIIGKCTGKVVYIGDGINDAPVLKRADCGIAMGAAGSGAAIEASDIVFMNDDIALLPESIRIARKTLNIVKENIVFSIAVKVLVLILTALGYADMWQAVFADVGVMVIAVLNTLRTLKL